MAEATLIARIVAKGQGAAKAAFEGITAEVKTLGQAMLTGFGAVATDLERVSNSLRSAGENARKSRRGVESFFDSIRSGRGLLGDFRTAIVDAFLITGIVSTFVSNVKRAVDAFAGLVAETANVNIQLDAAEIKLKASVTSTRELEAAQATLNAQVERFGLDLLSTKESLAEFLAATRISNLSLSERLSIFESLAQASRVFNLSQERVKLAFLAVSQIASKGCVDADTQILTRSGWLAQEDLRIGDEVAGLDLETGARVWHPVNDILRYPHLGNATVALAAGSEVVLANPHRVVAFDRVGGYGVKPASELDGTEEWPVLGSPDEQVFRRQQVELRRLETWSGVMWCPATESGTWIARKGDFLFVTGNSLAMEEVRRQLGDQIPGVVPLLAEKLGITVPELFEKVRNKAISAEEGLRALRDGLNDLTGAQAAEASEKLVASIGRLNTEITLTKEAFAEASEEGLQNFIEGLDEVLEKNKGVATSLGELSGGLLDVATPAVKVAGDLATIAGALVKSGAAAAALPPQLRGVVNLYELLAKAAERAAFAIRGNVVAEEEVAAATRESVASRILEKRRLQQLEERDALRLKELGQEVVSAAELAASQRVEAELSARREITDAERQLVDEKLSFFRQATEGARLSGEERETIERDITTRLLDIEDEYQRKRQQLIDDAKEKLSEQGSDRLKIEEDLQDKLFKLRLKREKDFEKLLDDRVKKVEQAAKKAADAWARFFDSLEGGADAGDIRLGTGGAEEEVRFFGDAFDQAKQKLEDLKREFETGFAAGEDVSGINQQILDLENNLIRIAQQGVPTFRESFVSAVGAISESGQKLLNDIERLEQGNARLASDYQNLGAEGQAAVDRIIQTYKSLAENTRITGTDQEEFARQLKEVFASGAEGSEELKQDLGEASDAAGDAGEAQLQFAKDAETGRLTLKQLGDAADEAAQKEGKLADKAGEVAQKAEIPQEVIDSIEQLGATAETVAPLLQPLVEPLTAVASSITDLSTAVPLLPEPLQLVAASIIELVQEEVLGPLAEGLTAIVGQFQPLSETVPVVSDSLEGFKNAAAESEEPLGTLETGLKKVAEPELLSRLQDLADTLDDVNNKLINLGSEGEGFARAEEAARDFRDVIVGDEGLLPKMKEFADYLTNAFQQALFEHASNWEEPLLAAQAYREELQDQVDVLFPAWSQAAGTMFEEAERAGRVFLALLREISRELAGIESAGDSILDEP